jgi:hypothetical protein
MVDEVWAAQVEANAKALQVKMAKKIADRPSANWQNIGDVDWEDLDFYVELCKTRPSKDNFDTAINVLTALKSQVLDRKSKA